MTMQAEIDVLIARIADQALRIAAFVQLVG
jgi:hypothetical protein